MSLQFDKELEEKCEMIMRKHKEKKGTLTWHNNTFSNVSDTTHAKELLLELGLIRWVGTLKRTTVLTSKGLAFESFEIERQKPKSPEIEKIELEIEHLRNNILDYKTVKKQAKIGLIIAAIAAVAAIIALFK